MRTLNRSLTLGLLAVAVALGALAPAASAATSQPTTITMYWQTPYLNGAPWFGTSCASPLPAGCTAPATWSASGAVNDSGPLLVSYHLGAASNPVGTVLNLLSDRTLVDSAQNTITLRCSETWHQVNDPAWFPVTGSCSVTGGSGAYGALRGQGTFGAGTFANLSAPGAGPAILSDVLQLNTH